MSFREVLAELPALTVAERQLLVQRALELDDAPLSVEEEAVVERRLAEHRHNPASALSLEEMKARVRAQTPCEMAGRVPARRAERPDGSGSMV